MLEKTSVHAGFLVFIDVLQMLAGEQKRLLLRLKSLQKVGIGRAYAFPILLSSIIP